MQIERSFKISCPHFGGFVADLSVNDFDSLDDIVSAVLDQLKATLAAGGFEALLSILDADAAKYHIHDMTLEGIIMGRAHHRITSAITDAYRFQLKTYRHRC